MKADSLIDNRVVRVFISSTFQDMEDERKYLITRTFPRLRQFAEQRDVMLTELDLRWGITEEESMSGKVVDICFREIENSIPFFIGIIGNRYGWVPDAKDLNEDVRERFPSVAGYLDRHLSVTEMEMQFGVLERPEDMHAFFFIKEEEGESDNLIMLRKLKDAVRSSRYPSYTYSSLEDLSTKVEQSFLSLLDRLFPETVLSEHQKVRRVQDSFIRKLSATYVRDDGNFRFLTDFALDPSSSYLVVTGESGMGKSSFLANWAKENAHSDRFTVIPYFSSNGGNQSHTHILKYLADEIADRFGFDGVQADGDDKLQKVLDLFSVKDETLVIVIDAINQIADVGQAKTLTWLPLRPKNVKFIFSTLMEDATMDVFKARGYPVFVLHKLERDQKQELVCEYLHSFGKKLEDELIQRTIDDKQCENTLVLKTLLDEIICNGHYGMLSSQIDYYLHSVSVSDFYEKVIARFEQDFGKEFVKRVLGLIAVSRNGVSEDRLLRLSGMTRLEWSEFFCGFSTHLNNQSGLLVFTHSYITNTVWHRYLDDDPVFEEDCRRSLIDGLLDSYSDYAKQEVPYQLDKLKDWVRLHDYIVSYRYLDYCMENDEVELGTYWRHIFENLPEEFSLEDYLNCTDIAGNEVNLYVRLLRLCRVLYRTKPWSVFVAKLSKLIEEKPELASVEVYLALTDSTPRPDSLTYANKALALSREQHNVLDEIRSLRALGGRYYDAAILEEDAESGQKAYDVWEEALHLSIGLYGETHPLIMHAYKDMGIMSRDQDKALELCLKAVDMGILLYGKDHPLVGRPYHYAGCIYRNLGRWEEALHYFREACRVWTPAYGINHEIMNSSYGNQGKALMNLGRLDEALECYDTCLRIQDAIFEEKGYDYAVCQFNRAYILNLMGRKQDALAICDEIEQVLEGSSAASEARSKTLMKHCRAFREQLSQS